MQKFILLIRGEDKWKALSPSEMQEVLVKYRDWTRGLHEAGRIVDAAPLDASGRTLSSADGVVTDGPFLETKEMVGGYYVFTAENLDEAVELCRGCPSLTYGGAVEVRPIANYA